MQIFEFLAISLYGLLLLANPSSQVDLTLEPETKGYDVTQAVIRKIYRSGIFEDDYFLIHRVAHISTRFGEDPKTYQENNPLRGIWQLSESQFNETLTNPNLTEFRAQIGQNFPEIGNWNSVSWTDLLKPLYNGLAFRLFTQQYFAPTDFSPYLLAPWPLLVDQAKFYASLLDPTADADLFINDTLAFEAQAKCQTEMDIVFIQDGSCTVAAPNFTDTREFIIGLIDSLQFSNIRVGYVVYSVDILQVLNLDNTFTQDELRNRIRAAGRPELQYTFTASAIIEGLSILENASVKREGVPQVLVLMTDGVAVEYLDDVTNSTIQAGVDSFSIGLSNGWSQDELLPIAHNKPGHVSKSQYTFSLFSEFLYRMNMEICSVPLRPGLNVKVNGTTGLNERRNYEFSFSQNLDNGMNVTVGVNGGQIRAYYSYSEETPSSALNDEELPIGQGTFVPELEGFDTLFVAVEGLDVLNNYEISVV